MGFHRPEFPPKDEWGRKVEEDYEKALAELADEEEND